MLIVDSFPGFICGSRKEIDGARLSSAHNALYTDSLCVMRFMSDDGMWTTKRLMLKFERFDISDQSVELKISGTSRGEVSLFHALCKHCDYQFRTGIQHCNF